MRLSQRDYKIPRHVRNWVRLEETARIVSHHVHLLWRHAWNARGHALGRHRMNHIGRVRVWYRMTGMTLRTAIARMLRRPVKRTAVRRAVQSGVWWYRVWYRLGHVCG